MGNANKLFGGGSKATPSKSGEDAPKLDAMSRKSTAFSNTNSEMGTPGSLLHTDKGKRQSSLRGSRGTSQRLQK